MIMAIADIKNGHGAQPVAFGPRLIGSDSFRLLFREGMDLVEAAAAYLDGAGRAEAKILQRMDALAYAAESMRLTTRLMQLASWLLMQRAVNDGELNLAAAGSERQKVKLSRQGPVADAEAYARLPTELRRLSDASLRLQDRLIHLDGALYAPVPPAERPQLSNDVFHQLDRLQAAFGQRLS